MIADAKARVARRRAKQPVKRKTADTAAGRGKVKVKPKPVARSPLVAGYSVLVVDTNVPLMARSLFVDLVESRRFLIIVPLCGASSLDGGPI